MIDGISIPAGGKEWIVPPLNLKQVKKFAPVLGKLGSFSNPLQAPEMFEAMLELIHSALSRNYPGLTLEEVEDMVDLGNLVSIIQAIMGVSGLVQPGETKAVSPSSGGTSTGLSPQPPGGPGTQSTT